ncbi:PLP-dependent transferase [Phellopilus nigrolimitatus]|nr:PLP-dependent transferase [Phellopilus nigrolimitatus]
MADSDTTLTLDVEKARANFPALQDGYIFADNAGGSQCLRSAAESVADYLLTTNVQLDKPVFILWFTLHSGSHPTHPVSRSARMQPTVRSLIDRSTDTYEAPGADYSVSVASTRRAAEGAAATAELVNAASPDEIAFAASSTMNAENLARALEADVRPGEEIVVTGEHEANAGPWKKLAARRGLALKTWAHTPAPGGAARDNPYAVELAVSALLPLLSAQTRLVAFSACSNILGTLVDVAAVVRAVRAEAARLGARRLEVCVDCVAYAPHRRIDVRAWDVDYCFFSYYKVYGPHVSALYARRAALTGSLQSLAHHFLAVAASAAKLAPGGHGYELPYAAARVLPYLRSLSPAGAGAGALDDAFARVAAHERALLRVLLGFLAGAEARARGVRVVGREEVDEARAPTVSFVVAGERAVRSRDVVAYFDQRGQMGIRYGHFYAYGLVAGLDPPLDPADAVVRISLVHYNTVAEAEALVAVLKEALAVL